MGGLLGMWLVVVVVVVVAVAVVVVFVVVVVVVVAVVVVVECIPVEKVHGNMLPLETNSTTNTHMYAYI